MVVKEVQVRGLQFECEDLFQTIENNAKAMAQLVEWELDSFHRTHIDLDKCKCALSWWSMEKHRFPIVGLLVWQIFEIRTSQIEIEWIFSIVGIFTTLRRCWLQTKNLDQMIVNKNQLNDLRVGCFKPSDLVSACKAKSDLTKELEVECKDLELIEKNS